MYAATDSRKLCPAGWHVPSEAEWTILVRGYFPGAPITMGTQSSTFGGILKEVGTVLWTTQSAGSNNISGFSARPSGYRRPDRGYTFINCVAAFWSTTFDLSDSTGATNRAMYDKLEDFDRLNTAKSTGLSIR